MTPRARQSGMIDQRQIRGLAVAGLLCAALAGCGSVVASSSAAAPGGTRSGTTPAGTAPAGTASAGKPATAAPQVACASVNQATAVTLRWVMRLAVPAGNDPFMITADKPALARALFNDVCNAVNHPYTSTAPVNCPAQFGTEFAGSFLDGHRVLATFTYAPTGCQRVSLTTAGKTQATMVVGPAAAAAPHLLADMDAVLGLKPGVMQPFT